MSNQYLEMIHEYLSKELARYEQERSNFTTPEDNPDNYFIDGRLEELRAIKKLIAKNFNLKTQNYT